MNAHEVSSIPISSVDIVQLIIPDGRTWQNQQNPRSANTMLTLIDLPLEMLERIATFAIAAERVPFMGRSILRFRLVHPAFGPPFLSALFQDLDCESGPGEYEDEASPLALSHMETIASNNSITHFTKKLSLTSGFDVRFHCIYGFPGLQHLTLTGVPRKWQCMPPANGFIVPYLTTITLECFNIARQDRLFRALPASCPNLQQVNVITQLHHVLHGMEQAVAIPLPSFSVGILQSSSIHLLVLLRFHCPLLGFRYEQGLREQSVSGDSDPFSHGVPSSQPCHQAPPSVRISSTRNR